jgi:PsbP-like protein
MYADTRMILTFCVVYQYQNLAKEVFATSQLKEGFSVYHSPKLGFEIAYPSDWVVEESPMGEGVYINAPISTQGKIDNSTKSLEEVLEEVKGKIEDIESGETESILMQIRVRNQTAEDPDNIKTIGVQSIQAKKEINPSINIIETSETTLAGLPAFKIVYTYGLSSGIKEMSVALSNNEIYTVGYSAPTFLYDVYLPEVEYAFNSTKINNSCWPSH